MYQPNTFTWNGPVCPSCGRCQRCGAGQLAPYVYPYPYPYWMAPTAPWTPVVTSGGTQTTPGIAFNPR